MIRYEIYLIFLKKVCKQGHCLEDSRRCAGEERERGEEGGGEEEKTAAPHDKVAGLAPVRGHEDLRVGARDDERQRPVGHHAAVLAGADAVQERVVLVARRPVGWQPSGRVDGEREVRHVGDGLWTVGSG